MTDEAWPTDEDGIPLSKVTASVTEKIPTAKYASVDILMSVTKWSPNGVEKDALDKAYEDADSVLQVKRDEILADLSEGNK